MNLIDLLHIYGNIIIEFLLELYIIYFLITKKLKRKENFKLRLSLGIIGVLSFAFLISIFYYYFGNTVIGRIFVYTSLFIVSIIHFKLILDESFWTVILCATLGYSLQNLVYKAYLTIWTGFQWIGLFDGLDKFIHFEIYYRLLYCLIFTGLIVLIYKLFIKKVRDKFTNTSLKYQLLILGIGVLLISNILCSLEDVFFAYLKSGRENEFDNYVYYVLRQTGNVFSIICCGIVVVLINQAIEKDDLKQKIEYLQHTIRSAERQYEISKNTIDSINIKCHDIKYKIEASLNSNKINDLDEINNLIAIYDSNIQTGNKLLDVLFTEKSLYCEQNNIKFSAMIDGTKLDFIEDGDLYCLFGNLMDNALEAVTKIPNEDKRIINFTVKSKDNLLIIQQDNYYIGDINFDKDGLPLTSKEDKKYHGFGMQSIKLLVEKYHGTMTTYVNSDVYHLNILFNLNDIKITK